MVQEFVIKHVPEEFIVKESIELELEGGPFSYYLLRKRDYTTQKALDIVSTAFHKRLKFINFSGNKDRRAVTEQFISILHGPKKDLEREDLFVKFIGLGKERINLGQAVGNHFEIVVRGLHKAPENIVSFPNYFGEQRFGIHSNNHMIGKYMVKKDFRSACSLLKQSNPNVDDYLKQFPNDFVGALRCIPKGVLRLFPHSYQSFLWNMIISEHIGKNLQSEKKSIGDFKLNFPFPLPILTKGVDVGFKVPMLSPGVEIPKEVKEIFNKVLKEESVELNDFVFKQFPEINIQQVDRNVFSSMKELKISELEDDDIFKGKKKCKIMFFLDKGCYATVALKALF